MPTSAMNHNLGTRLEVSRSARPVLGRGACRFLSILRYLETRSVIPRTGRLRHTDPPKPSRKRNAPLVQRANADGWWYFSSLFLFGFCRLGRLRAQAVIHGTQRMTSRSDANTRPKHSTRVQPVGKITARRTLHANRPIILEFLEVHGKILKKIKCLKLKLIKMYKLKLPYNMSKKITKIFVQ